MASVNMQLQQLWSDNPSFETLKAIESKAKSDSRTVAGNACILLSKIHAQGFASKDEKLPIEMDRAKQYLHRATELLGREATYEPKLLFLVQQCEREIEKKNKKTICEEIEKLASEMATKKRMTSETHFVLGVHYSRLADISRCQLQLVRASELGHLRSFLNYASLEYDLLAQKCGRMRELIKTFLAPFEKTKKEREVKEKSEKRTI